MLIHEGRMSLEQITITTLTLLSLINLIFYLGSQETAGMLTMYLSWAWAIGGWIMLLFVKTRRQRFAIWEYCGVAVLWYIIPHSAYAVVALIMGLILAPFAYNQGVEQ